MCIAIYKPENMRLRKWALKNAFDWNSHGSGFLVFDHKRNKLRAFKGFFTFKAFYEVFKKYNEGYRCVLHFRWATHGKRDAANCHPFLVNENLGFVHNGVLKEVKMWDDNYSDTWHFNEAIAKQLHADLPNFWKNEAMQSVLESYIGGSKMIFMDNRGEVKILNPEKGHWENGVWFSNDSYKKRPTGPRPEYGSRTNTSTNTTTYSSTNNTQSQVNRTVTSGGTSMQYRSGFENSEGWLNRGGNTSSNTSSNTSGGKSDEQLLEELMREAEAIELHGKAKAEATTVTYGPEDEQRSTPKALPAPADAAKASVGAIVEKVMEQLGDAEAVSTDADTAEVSKEAEQTVEV